MLLPRFELHRPDTLDEALELLNMYGSNARVLAGGTELLVLLRDRRIEAPKYIIDINKLRKELSYVHIDNGWIRIGSLTSIWDLDQSILGSDKRYAGFHDVFTLFGTMSLKFMATIGGNIVSATQYSDYITLLLVYDAKVKLKSIEGERVVDLEKFIIDKRIVDLKSNELLIEIMFPEPSSSCSSSFIKFDRRKQLIAGVVTGATYMCLEDNVVKDIRISFDMVRDKRIPSRVHGVEELLRGREFSEELLDEACNALSKEMVRVSDWWTSAEYRLDMSRVVLRRNLYRTYERIRG